ncbi:hypothetical protein SAMN03080594_102654 [Arenibacter palladensis]|uniref:Uncharacterized protein n=1 Tax=Arenibacter palladensis TaxID=237373 RepID=A0A1M4Z1A9_9FLAO|nr:hypothetical protein [Arenibacter palladensis]MDO6601814.1 hypothetical protein [Arenibacter palladensis]SHF11738.1 hypothetical protein SAMN03080594_102654 [Arenibacter palladensis]
MITIFKTNINEEQESSVRQFLNLFKEIVKVDFDFEDSDNILRIETVRDIAKQVEVVLNSNGYCCTELL